jgi:hypothetical protein
MTHMHFSSILAIYRIEGYDRLIFRWWWVVMAIVALMILLATWRATVWFILWWNRPRSNPLQLFKHLSRVHGLNSKEIALFNVLKPKLPQGMPVAVLFVDPATWRFQQVDDEKTRDSLAKLYAKIFGFPPEQLGS